MTVPCFLEVREKSQLQWNEFLKFNRLGTCFSDIFSRKTGFFVLQASLFMYFRKKYYTITNQRRRKSMEKVKCPKCGFEVKQGTELCPKCGEPVKDYYVYQKIREKVEQIKGDKQ